MTYIRLEDDVKNLYLKIGVDDVTKLDMEVIAYRKGYSIEYISGISKYIDSHKTFYINRYLTKEEKWQHFAHELGHATYHAGNQMTMDKHYREFQEWQAKNFAYEACVPRFILEKELSKNPHTDPVALIVDLFGVTYKFARTRFVIYCLRKAQYSNEMFRLVGVY